MFMTLTFFDDYSLFMSYSSCLEDAFTANRVTYTQSGGGLVASGRAYQLRIPRSSLGTGLPLFYVTTAEWPKITHMLP